MISILNELALQKTELQKNYVNNIFGQNKKNTTIKQKSKHKNPCKSRALDPAPLAPQSSVLPLGHPVN